MKYYLIAGEASGDLHASELIKSISRNDPNAQFRFVGGDFMASVAGVPVCHYKDLAYMGLIPVLLHLRTILNALHRVRKDILFWNPDVLILVDYPGFNLRIAKYIRSVSPIPIVYYISPKIWAWKEFRIKTIRKNVNLLLSILPFEVPYFENKHSYKVFYVGNPTLDEVRDYQQSNKLDTFENFISDNNLTGKPIIAILAGSRINEIKRNLSLLVRVSLKYASDYQIVLAAAPGIPQKAYSSILGNENVSVLYGQTYRILAHATLALVTSGTATLETALFSVPQVVCYGTILPKLTSFAQRLFLKVPYISLVNLILNEPAVTELVAAKLTEKSLASEVEKIMPLNPHRQIVLKQYERMLHLLGNSGAPSNAAALIHRLLFAG